MSLRVGLVLGIGALALASCKKPEEVVVEETRPLTTADQAPVINASSAERFLPKEAREQMAAGDVGGGPGAGWSYKLPEGWREAGARMMRKVNLAFGEEGEVYLSEVGGGLKANADRWFRQFGNEPKDLGELERVSFAGGEAILLETAGRYEPGMGRPGKDQQGLLGLLAETEKGLVTIKLIAGEAEVQAQRENFLAFVASLERSE